MPVETREAVRPRTEPRPSQRDPAVGGILLGLVLVGSGALWLFAALGVDIPVAVVAPVVLVALGIAVVVSAVRGEDHGIVGLAVFVGLWLAIASLVTALVGVPLTGAVGDRVVAPDTVAELEGGYRLFAGSQTVDLGELRLDAGTVELEVSTLLGEVEVVVPADMAVRVNAGVGAGTVDLDGTVIDGVGLSDEDSTEGWAAAVQRLDLRIRVGLGEVRVRIE